ncbi:hypothetical protein [Kitasatospora sp. NPDC088351]|uniref:hypothetical protein n=1 Tax=Kitasatospora sp. NPDC088351 TaxID=3155180 RepID=UPI003429EF02
MPRAVAAGAGRPVRDPPRTGRRGNTPAPPVATPSPAARCPGRSAARCRTTASCGAAPAQALRDGRAKTEQHDAPGERAIAQTRLALVTAFTNPTRADEEIDLARQYLEPLDQRTTVLLNHVAAMVRDAGTDRDIADRATALRAQIDIAGLPWLIPLLETALAFHHAIRGAEDDLTATIARLRDATANGDFAYYLNIAHFLASLPPVRRHG